MNIQPSLLLDHLHGLIQMTLYERRDASGAGHHGLHGRLEPKPINSHRAFRADV